MLIKAKNNEIMPMIWGFLSFAGLVLILVNGIAGAWL